MNGAASIKPAIVSGSVDALPVLAAVVLATLDQVQVGGSNSWSEFLTLCGLTFLGFVPLLVAHLAACRLGAAKAAAAWLAGFVILPVALQGRWLDGLWLADRHWLLGAGFSLIALLAGSARPGRLLLALNRLPVTLDGAIVALIAAFVLLASSMFASIDDPVNNQPFRVWFDPGHISAHPVPALGYLAQFTIVGALLFGFYGGCRHLLVRRILREQGWIAFGFASLVFWIVYVPLAASLALLLPLNVPYWTLLPSENHNPFDPTNYAFGLLAWATFVPLILASERLLAERSAAIGQHEQARAELQMLHQQINPHFLFNSLNTLYALCLRDRAASAEAIVKLSDLLRYVVYQGSRDWVGLDEEIEYLRNYLDLQMLRFGQRCRLTCTWPDEPAGYRIPPLLLIMLVENAFKHGVEPAESETALDIALDVAGLRMQFTCRNAPLPPSIPAQSGGVGLGNLRRRLELLFGTDFALASAAEGDGWNATLGLELRPC